MSPNVQRASLRPGTVLEFLDQPALEAASLLDKTFLNPQRWVDEAVVLARDCQDESSVRAVLSRRAAAMALREVGRVTEAVDHARSAHELASRLGDRVAQCETEKTLAHCLLRAGKGTDALEAAERAVRSSEDLAVLNARALVQRALVRQRLGRDGWMTDYETALPQCRAAGDEYWEAIGLLNRGAALIYLGRLQEAEQDFRRIATLRGTEKDALAGFAQHNLGFALSRRGELPAALEAFAGADAVLTSLGDIDTSPSIVDRGDVLLTAGLPGEAINLLVPRLEHLVSHQPALAPEALLILARAHDLKGQHDSAVSTAAESAARFDEQGRDGWAQLARAVEARASLAAGELHPENVASVAQRAWKAGWPNEAAELLALAAREWVGSDSDRAAALLRSVHDTDTLSLTARLAVAATRTALARERGEEKAALDEAGAALTDLDMHRALLGASELRANVGRHAEHVMSQGALAALELGDYDQTLAWVDRMRSQALDHPPVMPPDDAELADALGRLRVIADAVMQGRAGGEDVSALVVEQAELEERVRDRARTARGHGITDVETGTRAPGTIEIAWLNLHDHLVALVADDTGTRRVDLDADTDAIGTELDALGFAMQRVGRSRAPGRRRDLAARSLEHSLAALDAALVAPLDLPDDGAVVLSPTSVLFDVPWSGLPSLLDRAVAIAPSLRLARRPARRDVGTGTVLVEGPRLAHARDELTALAGVVDDPQLVLGEEATVAAARDALPEAAIAHLACHGVFRADNPQFSSLELADGPMFVYDLEALPRVPELLVLSACQTGRSAVHAGDELLGVTASLLAMGARHVVAALADVPDDLSAVLMVAFHDAVAAGASPAAALARARGVLLDRHDDPAARLTAAAFACIGAP